MSTLSPGEGPHRGQPECLPPSALNASLESAPPSAEATAEPWGCAGDLPAARAATTSLPANPSGLGLQGSTIRNQQRGQALSNPMQLFSGKVKASSPTPALRPSPQVKISESRRGLKHQAKPSMKENPTAVPPESAATSSTKEAILVWCTSWTNYFSRIAW